ncbi:hypothetical protein [Thermophilibacter immobilis]|jgi:hypothetical protein|uniref:Uncharacterized protein n=1 Tax=Thermophilibacter immobilis TaxID=2779519 RepID=A0A7S7RV68_9ACTN|nr:hypothetical protein [Thermophilibacter immobilis]QOY61323.1 hypothetical protein INP52_03785 [Thermophilibacter immobilis]
MSDAEREALAAEGPEGCARRRGRHVRALTVVLVIAALAAALAGGAWLFSARGRVPEIIEAPRAETVSVADDPGGQSTASSEGRLPGCCSPNNNV